MTYEGACHCGSLRAWFQTARSASDIQVRACACGFCRRHGARTVSDPDGWLEVRGAPGSVTHYRFASHGADFLMCAECGVYMAAVIEDGDRWRGILNTAGAGLEVFAGRVADVVDYSEEEAAGRRDRRLVQWTPALVVEAQPNA